MKIKAYLAISVLMMGAGACSSKENDDKPSTGEVVTYWQDVAPVYKDRCVRCHQEGGIGPFRLDTYEDAKAHAQAELARVTEGTMPPYFMVNDGSCESFHDDVSLTAAEKSTITAWVNGGTPQGTPVALTLPTQPKLEDAVDVTTPSFAPVAVGDQLAMYDEYRCFALDAPIAADAFITGYAVTPGDASIVHHVLAFVVDPQAMGRDNMTNAAVMQALDGESPDRLGWPCFGAAGEGVGVTSVPVTWAPGQGIVSYPAGMGVPVHPTDKIVVQLHYNLADPASAGKVDSTAVHLHFASSVERELAFLLPDPFLGSLENTDSQGHPMPDTLPPHQANTKYTWKRTGQQIGVDGVPWVDLMAVFPHMHGRGVRQEMRMGAPGALACASRLEKWNFHWQEMYFYKSPPRLTPDMQFEVTCEYDTSQDQVPVLPGWGTRNEMCLTTMMVALPPR